MKSVLSNAHTRTYEMVFQHPISHNLEWRELKSLFSEMGSVSEEHNGNLKISVHGQTIVFSTAHGKDVASSEEVIKIRHFLEDAGLKQNSMHAMAKTLLITIDHAEALVFHLEMKDEVPDKIVPYDPHGLGRHCHTLKTDISIHEKANRKSFYEGIAKTAEGAERILVFGDGTGSSSEMKLFLTELEEEHPAIASKICGSCTVDLSHLSEPQLLAKAHEFFAKLPAAVR